MLTENQKEFPLVTLSMAVIAVKKGSLIDMDNFSRMLVKAKRESKSKEGNSYYCVEI